MVLFYTFRAACCGAVVALAWLNRHEAIFAPDLCCTAFHKLPVRCCSVSRQGISVPVVIFSCTRHTTLLRRLVTCPRSRLMTQLLYTYGYFFVDCVRTGMLLWQGGEGDFEYLWACSERFVMPQQNEIVY
jgi:hypothetical protein